MDGIIWGLERVGRFIEGGNNCFASRPVDANGKLLDLVQCCLHFDQISFNGETRRGCHWPDPWERQATDQQGSSYIPLCPRDQTSFTYMSRKLEGSATCWTLEVRVNRCRPGLKNLTRGGPLPVPRLFTCFCTPSATTGLIMQYELHSHPSAPRAGVTLARGILRSEGTNHDVPDSQPGDQGHDGADKYSQRHADAAVALLMSSGRSAYLSPPPITVHGTMPSILSQALSRAQSRQNADL